MSSDSQDSGNEKSILEAVRQALDRVRESREVEEIRTRYLGRKGEITRLLRALKETPPEDRPRRGEELNKLKAAIDGLLLAKTGEIESATEEAGGLADPTLPGTPPWTGTRHIISKTLDDIIEIFHGMGFSTAGGPEAELDYYNFEALNFPPDHPSRDTQDTFFLGEDILLRTHTSPVQIRVMEKSKPPLRYIFPGKVYRNESIDASHSAEFHQVEGLYVDERVSMPDLKEDLEFFAQRFFGPEVRLRFRPHHFPFTEPSAEADMTCHMCRGEGCNVCGKSGWIEIAGCGMVHPNVFRAAGVDPERYTGYAWGFGVERLIMLKYGIDDIRHFLTNDLRFLEQFG